MVKIGKQLLSQLTSGGVSGPFVTIMLNKQMERQGIEKNQLKLKNFAKEAKQRFEKRYPEQDWQAIQGRIDAILADQTFWRNSASKSVAIILTPNETFIHHLSIEVDDQYYVGDTPYLLAIIKNAQFNYNYYLLALNRDSLKIYRVENKKIQEVLLPDNAPTDIKKALGEELTGGNWMNASSSGSQEGAAYHSFNTKDEEVEIDWTNYYQAVDHYLRHEFENEENLPIYLFALPENQALFKKIAKNQYLSTKASVTASPAQLSLSEIETQAEKITNELKEVEVQTYQKLMDRKFIDQLVDISHNAKEGKIAQLFISTSNLVDGFGEDPDTEYDRRQVLNTMSEQVIENGGEVFILNQKDAPDEKSLVAILRY